MRPAALMRGAKVKPMQEAVRLLPSAPASRMRALSPGRRVLASAWRPRRTMARFSPESCMTSATVPMAARSAYSLRTRSRSDPGVSASASFSATPTPARHGKG